MKGTIMTSMTSNQPSTIDETGFAVRRTIRIAAPVEKVWSAVTQPEHISRWFGKTTLEGNVVGSTGSIMWPDGRTVPLRIEALDEPRSVTYRWNNDDVIGETPEQIEVERSTEFTFTLDPVSGGTQLTVVESGFADTSDPKANMEGHSEGWDSELDKLVALLESGSQ
jgi:uncharacterized protein YndB with AHSA1/START domain